jgi:asparagine synthase (glutamine-hydrolysing)
MGRAQRHRGPDDRGSLVDGELMIGMERLAIIDVAGGHQPISNEDGCVTTICNGEIYNFRELRKELEQQGHRFKSNSDSEVIVHLYEELGDDFVGRLSGMFALAVWDARRRKLLLARDRLGIKPLYIWNSSRYFAFSSELKSLLEIPDVERKVNAAALDEYLALGYVPAPRSILEGVEKLRPGTTLIIENEKTRVRQYSRPTTSLMERKPIEDWASEIASEVEASVVAQMVSDVPLGAFLSGGIDSSAVVAFMARNSSRPVKTYSIGFDTESGRVRLHWTYSIGFDTESGGQYYNELPYARQISDRFGTEHHEIVVKPAITELLPSLLWHVDEPVADAAFITTYLVSKFAREGVPVILSGVGGDELFGGYRRYWGEALVQMYHRIPAILRRSVISPIVRQLPGDRHSTWLDRFRLMKAFVANAELDADARYENFIRVFKSGELKQLLGEGAPDNSVGLAEAFDQAAAEDALHRLIDVDLTTQLPDDLLMLTDRMSMAASLECRVPLLDDRLLDLSKRMPSDMKVRGTDLKVGLKRALRGVLPNEIIDRKKRGFGAPIGAWIKKELAGYLDTVLDEEQLASRELFSVEAVRKLKQDHAANREDYTDHLLALMNFEIWCQIYLDNVPPEEVTANLTERQAA